VGRNLRRYALAGAIVALAAGLGAASPPLDAVGGLSIDVLTALRWRAFGPAHDPAASPTVVVALDEETYASTPFAGTPNITWTREIGRVLTGLIEGGAKVVGFDVVFPTSIEQSEIPFGDETLGARVRGFDRDFLRALALAAREGKIVLGQVQHSEHPIAPAPGQRAAVGHQRNIRGLNLHTDRDDVVRRVPLKFETGGGPQPSMAVELAARALGATPEFGSDGTLKIAGYRAAGVVPNTLALNFAGGADDIPTFSLADLRACLEKGDKDFFRRHFAGKVVLIGVVLDVEDRKITSKRFATAPEGARAARCALPEPRVGAKFARDSIAGVYVHATAVNNLIRQTPLTELDRIERAAIAIALAALTALAALALSPLPAALAFFGIFLAWTGFATLAFHDALALPLIEPLLGGVLALAILIGYRFVVADKDKRFLRRSFALYLAPAVIERMLASNTPPALGGETRNVTVFFSDLAGFSALSEKMSPADVVALMNVYLSAMTEIIEAEGGFVDKYIGDAIVAVFGAPISDPDHAKSAVRAALRCCRRLEELNQSAGAFKGHALGQRIGLNSGAALVGNIGSRVRFNYTVMGDTVNLASRLEGANKAFGTAIIASEATVALSGGEFVWRELDAIRVKGRAQPLKIYEPLSGAGAETGDQLACAAAYAAGLERWRARNFAGAKAAFAPVAGIDRPSELFLARANLMALNPPGEDWEPINTLETK